MTEVTTQAELDAVPAGEWCYVTKGEFVARGSSHVVARGSSHVEARGSSHVEARDSSHVEARDSSHVVARDSSHVEAWDSSHVVARDSSHVVARDFVACHAFPGSSCKALSPQAVIIVVDYPPSVEAWCALKGIKPTRGCIKLWKVIQANGTDFCTGAVNYLAKGEIVAPDWDSTYKEECGKGLHLADSMEGALSFLAFEQRETARVLQVKAKVIDCKVFPGNPQWPEKLRARACWVVKEVPNPWAKKSRREKEGKR